RVVRAHAEIPDFLPIVGVPSLRIGWAASRCGERVSDGFDELMGRDRRDIIHGGRSHSATKSTHSTQVRHNAVVKVVGRRCAFETVIGTEYLTAGQTRGCDRHTWWKISHEKRVSVRLRKNSRIDLSL